GARGSRRPKELAMPRSAPARPPKALQPFRVTDNRRGVRGDEVRRVANAVPAGGDLVEGGGRERLFLGRLHPDQPPEREKGASVGSFDNGNAAMLGQLLDQYRNHVRLLARTQMGPALKARLEADGRHTEQKVGR